MGYEIKSQEVVDELKAIGINIKQLSSSTNVSKTIEYLIANSDASVVHETIASFEKCLNDIENCIESCINGIEKCADESQKISKSSKQMMEKFNGFIENIESPKFHSEKADDALKLFNAMMSLSKDKYDNVSDARFNSIAYCIYAFLKGDADECNDEIKNIIKFKSNDENDDEPIY